MKLTWQIDWLSSNFVAAEKGALFEKVQQNKETDGASTVSSELLQVEDLEEEQEEEPKTEDTTEKTLTKDETENKDSETGQAAQGVEEKEDEAATASAIDVEVKT